MKQQTNEEILHKIFTFKKEGLKVLIGGLLIKMVNNFHSQQVIGIFYAWPIIYSFHSVMIQYDRLSKFKQSLLFFAFPLMNLTMNIFLPRGDYVLTHYGPKQTVILFTSLISISLTIMGFAKDFLLLQFVLLVFIVGPSVGCLYMVPFQVTWKYFIKQKSQLNSIFQIFMGLGACLAIYVFEQKTNNGKVLSLYFDGDDQQTANCYQLDIRESYRQMALIILSMGLIASILIKKPEESDLEVMIDYDLLAYSFQDIYVYQGDNEVLDKDVPTFTKSIKSTQFKTMVMIVFISTCILKIIILVLPYIFFSQYQKLNKLLGIDYPSSIISFKVSIVFYGLLRTIISFLSDKYQYHHTMLAMISTKIVLTLFLMIGIFTESVYLSAFCCSGLMILLSGIFSTFSVYIPRVFGASVAQSIFSTILVFLAISNLFAQIISFFFMENIISIILMLCLPILAMQFYTIKLLIKTE